MTNYIKNLLVATFTSLMLRWKNARPSGMLIVLSTSNAAFDAPNKTKSASVAVAGSLPWSASAGKITITGLTAAAGATQIVTLVDTQALPNRVTAADRVNATINEYTGTIVTDGVPIVSECDNTTTPGSIIIRITNIHGANALGGDLTLSLQVSKPVVPVA